MALVPLLEDLLLDNYTRRHMYDPVHGFGYHPRFLITPLSCGYLRPWRSMDASQSGVSSVTNTETEFKVDLDVQQFKPEELKVKLADDGSIVIQGKHEEKSDQHGFISREFTRRYKLPEMVQPETLTSNLSSDGVLSIQAKKKIVKSAAPKEIKIVPTNKPAVKHSDEKSDDKKME